MLLKIIITKTKPKRTIIVKKYKMKPFLISIKSNYKLKYFYNTISMLMAISKSIQIKHLNYVK